MKASEFAANSVATLAAHMGWSKPILDSPVQSVKNEPFQCAANTMVGERAHKLTLDPHQELTVDPSVVSVKEDEMTISSLCRRECYLTTFKIQTSDPIMTPVITMAVHPRIVEPITLESNDYVQPSPMAFVASQFVYWHGDITYRFDVVKSSFHRGKFAIIWEPNIAQRAIINGSLDLNKQYVYIVDLQEVEEFEVTVKWNGPQAWFEVPNGFSSKRSINIFPVDTTFYTRQCNGYIMVVPITDLQAPEDKSVHVNVFIKSNNMRFAVPNANNMWSNMVTESGSECVSIDINTAGSSDSGISEYHFGEECVTMRSIFKRYRTHLAMSGEVTSAVNGIIRFVLPVQPILSFDAGLDAVLSQWRNCFIGLRGGFKYRIRPAMSNPIRPLDSMSVSMESPSITTPTSVTHGIVTAVRNFLTGSTTFIPYTQPGLEVEIPYYNTALFSFSQLNVPSPNNVSYMIPNQMRTWQFAFNAGSEATGRVMVDVATGEDFMFLGFLKAPLFIDNSSS
jgi:hypothetical protein